MRGSKMKYILKSAITILLVSFLSSMSYALENLEPISSDRLLIDGYLGDWNQMRRQSAEYLLKGTIASMEDFQGGLKVAYNKDWLYLGIDCQDSNLLGGRNGDQVKISLRSTKKQKASLMFSLKKKTRRLRRKKRTLASQDSIGYRSNLKVNQGETQNDAYYFQYRLNSSSKSEAIIKTAISETGYTIEAKIPMAELPWVYGAEVMLAAIFTDRDNDRANSVYSTHIVDRRGSVDQVSYIFGGAQLFKLVYEEEVPPFKVIEELIHDWAGDHRDELMLITDSEIVLFGDAIRSESGFIRYVHGWLTPHRTRFTVSGVKGDTELKVELLNKDGSVQTVELFKLQAGQLKKQ